MSTVPAKPGRLAPWGPHGRQALIVVAAIFLVDQVVKTWVLYGLELPRRGQIPVLPFFDLTMVWNYGISYGLFQQQTFIGWLVLIAIKLVAAIVFWLWAVKAESRLLTFGLGLIIGGALGNALDRVLYGAVADFAHLFWGDWSWYVFNVADAAIVVGVIVLVYDSFRPAKPE